MLARILYCQRPILHVARCTRRALRRPSRSPGRTGGSGGVWCHLDHIVRCTLSRLRGTGTGDCPGPMIAVRRHRTVSRRGRWPERSCTRPAMYHWKFPDKRNKTRTHVMSQARSLFASSSRWRLSWPGRTNASTSHTDVSLAAAPCLAAASAARLVSTLPRRRHGARPSKGAESSTWRGTPSSPPVHRCSRSAPQRRACSACSALQHCTAPATGSGVRGSQRQNMLALPP